MRLLFDENISEALIRAVLDVYPDCLHVRSLGRGGATDREVWQLAKHHNAFLVTRDEDFRELSILVGPPPKVIWLDVGNARTSQLADLLRRCRADVERFEVDTEAAYLVLRLP